ncbi:divalent metal cation transporter [Streptomyces lunalinharesii]|uniref:Divalent metal cation transporter n=1 Tax=Streptomyces lunalinharesii TaxID=333384 RepID=A0ABN3RQQ1_9ACTN
MLDDARVTDVHGALGSIRAAADGPRRGTGTKVKTLLAVVGPGLIVMVGDNDAGAFATYGQAGQNHGTALLWTLLLLIPVLYVNQEMALRLGAVTGVGHARLILARFGRFWGAFSVVDLFALNALTVVTEFIGIALALRYLGLPEVPGVLAAACLVVAAACTGSFRRFERFAVFLCVGSLLAVPLYVMAHPPAAQIARGLLPSAPSGGSGLGDVLLLIIAIVGTTVAPWQLFFQQSYVADKRITPCLLRYEKADLWIGIAVAIVGAGAVMAFTAAAFAGTAGFGHFGDAAGIARGLEAHAGRAAGVLFAVALLDASVMGASTVSLSTAYALSDVLGVPHSLHRGVRGAKGFYACFALVVAVAAAVVLIPGSPLGLLTEGVQTLAGVLLPSATVFLLLLCNDRMVLGPWVNGRLTNAFTALTVGVLVVLSLILTATVLLPHLSPAWTAGIAAATGGFSGLSALGYAEVRRRRRGFTRAPLPIDRSQRQGWRMPPLAELPAPVVSTARKVGLTVLRTYLGFAVVLVIVRIVQLATG